MNKTAAINRPLAEAMRPSSLEEFFGQRHILAKGQILYESILNDHLHSMIFWGPPGCGKTSLAHIIAKRTQSRFIFFSAVLGGVPQLREIITDAKHHLENGTQKTILLIDEIHRFNKSQQDALLPHVETGDIILIGATTENPSFSVNRALLSRAKVYRFEMLEPDEVTAILKHAQGHSEALQCAREMIEEKHLTALAKAVDGDARRALAMLSQVDQLLMSQHQESPVDVHKIIQHVIERETLAYDASGDQHFDSISALHKSMRNSDSDASLYWLARMLESGEDPMYIARRLIRFASEDIGLADPTALTQCIAAKDTVQAIGLPEAKLALAQATIYCATAPKSNRIYEAYKKVAATVQETGSLPVPLHLRNAISPLMKSFDYGKGYQYAHDFDSGTSDMTCLPEIISDRTFYVPKEIGFEREVGKRIAYYRRQKEKGKS